MLSFSIYTDRSPRQVPFLITPSAYKGEFFIFINENDNFVHSGLELIKFDIRQKRVEGDPAVGRYSAEEVGLFLKEAGEWVGWNFKSPY